jgi:phosphate uptake regulator
MDARKIQRSGTTYYLYLPAAWCREQNITTDSIVFLRKNSDGDLTIAKNKSEDKEFTLDTELKESSSEVINKFVVASYINPIRNFEIRFGKTIDTEQILHHKKMLSGIELLDFEEEKVICQSTLSNNDPEVLLSTMIRKITSMVNFIKKGTTPELIDRYEREIDKCNLLVNKAIISSLMHKRDSNLRHVELFYVGNLSRFLEELADTVNNLEKDDKVLDVVTSSMKRLESILEHLDRNAIASFIKDISKYEKIKVKDSKTYYYTRIHSILGHIGDVLADWVVTNMIESNK